MKHHTVGLLGTARVSSRVKGAGLAVDGSYMQKIVMSGMSNANECVPVSIKALGAAEPVKK